MNTPLIRTAALFRSPQPMVETTNNSSLSTKLELPSEMQGLNSENLTATSIENLKEEKKSIYSQNVVLLQKLKSQAKPLPVVTAVAPNTAALAADKARADDLLKALFANQDQDKVYVTRTGRNITV